MSLSASITSALAAASSGPGWAVVCGDCRELTPLLPDGAVAHVLADPPFEVEAHSKGRRTLGSQAKPGGRRPTRAALAFAPIDPKDRLPLAREWRRLCGGWALAFCQIEAVGAWRAAMRRAGARWRRGQVWRKTNGQPALDGSGPGLGFECIATAWCGRGRSRWRGGGRHGFYEHAMDANFSSEPRVHETQKPLRLMVELVDLFTWPGELVLDPFCGSGSTGVACVRTGRRFLGFELDPVHAAAAAERIAREAVALSAGDAERGQQGRGARVAALLGRGACSWVMPRSRWRRLDKREARRWTSRRERRDSWCAPARRLPPSASR